MKIKSARELAIALGKGSVSMSIISQSLLGVVKRWEARKEVSVIDGIITLI